MNAGCVMSTLRVLVLAVVIAMGLQPVCVSAAGSVSAVLLGFGDEYAAPDGSPSVHRGVDVAATAGERFLSTVEGEVTFAGRVPGPHGGSVMAVTASTAHGKVSMMPFDQLDVAKGDSLEVGLPVGRVAAEGDPSSSQPHVHLSLRREDLYVDPAALLAALAPSGAPVSEPVEAPVRSPSPAGVPGGSPAPVPTPSVTPVPAGQSVSAAPSLAPLATGVSLAPATKPATGDVRAKPAAEVSAPSPAPATRVAIDSGVSVPHVTAASSEPEADAMLHTTPLETLIETAYSAVRSGGELLARYALTTTILISAAFAAAAVLLSRRAMARRITCETPVSHRWGTLLQQLRTGDRLRGFTSCSGHAAFTVPGPFSPEEVTK